MRLHLIHDDEGRILAAVDLSSGGEGQPTPHPAARDDQAGVELEVPEQYLDLGLAEICTRLRVDLERGELCMGEPPGAS
ncbi:MAG: hypothetical protein GEV08_22020 [Acidimicrobiia bacterium]|nr:hypothetical protein [Acidimicrobiia bacterium]